MDINFISCILVLLVMVPITHSNSELVDPLGWNYDRGTKSSKQILRSSNSRGKEDAYESFHHEEENELVVYARSSETPTINEHSQLKTQRDYFIKPLRSYSSNSVESVDFIKRFINLLLRASGLSRKSMVSDESSSVDIDLTVTAAELETLERFSTSDGEVSLQEVDSILSNVIRSKNFNIPREYFGWLDTISFILHSKETWFKLGMVGLPAVLVWMVLVGHKIARIITIMMVIIFSSSYVVTYYRLYKGVEIRQMQILQQHTEVPIECRPVDMSWWQSLIHSFTSFYEFDKKKCQRYHEALLIDPILEVWPTRVLSEMMSDFLLAPSGRIGAAIASFTNGIMRDLPPMYAWFVYIFASVGVFILLVLGLILLCGGRMRIGGILMGIEMSSGQSQRQVTAGVTESLPTKNCIKDGESNHPLIDTIKSSSKGLVLMDVHSVRELCTTNLIQHRDAVEDLQPSDSDIKGDKQTVSISSNQSIESKGKFSSTSLDSERSNFKPKSSSMPTEKSISSLTKSDSHTNSPLPVALSRISTEKPDRKDSGTMTESEESLSCEIQELRNLTMSPVELCSHGINICRQIRNNSKPRCVKTLVEKPINSLEIQEMTLQSDLIETEDSFVQEEVGEILEQKPFSTCEIQDDFGVRLRNCSTVRSLDGSGDAK